MRLFHLRLICQIVGGLTVVSNLIWFVLAYQFAQNGHLLGIHSMVYSACALAVGFIGLAGSSKNHAGSIYIFANFLLVDSILVSVFRILFLLMISGWAQETLCKPVFVTQGPMVMAEAGGRGGEAGVDVVSSWSKLGSQMIAVPNNNPAMAAEESCSAVIYLVAAALVVGLLSTAVVQLFFISMVLQYSRALAARTDEVASTARGRTDDEDGATAKSKERWMEE